MCVSLMGVEFPYGLPYILIKVKRKNEGEVNESLNDDSSSQQHIVFIYLKAHGSV